MRTPWKPAVLVTALVALGVSCTKNNDPEPVNQEEEITTMHLMFTEVGNAGNTFTVSYRDPDGTGGNAPTLDSIVLATNTTYQVEIQLLNESDPNDVADITAEVQQESDEHLFCFEPANLNLVVERTDSDGTYEVGITSEWTTTTASEGSIQIQLRHQPGVKDGSCTPGESDLQVTFPGRIQ
ncbi:hypothetical protein SAMN05421823_102353 [Catalinimonas alkaloidigena]|uniref:Type 1 periplasmic binding fold superfamily protein n=1 Tax=Catalinimonas alkaloidigena TaxID=1075417 RepID=A0A1G9AMS9_9BACT|nr:hypothetical protein [Catalinimonas alkaloidigena]SDK28553.1 hypothetical protein SAMN05421823_102353 [Catalinimonas alkaloidigena]